MNKNPFKFGTVVDNEFFTNRHVEIKQIHSIIQSENHLVLISPRRYGKTSLVNKVIKETKRPYIFLDLQILTNVEDFSAQLLQRTLKLFPYEKAKQFIKTFRIIPNIALNPLSNEIDISFNPVTQSTTLLEDVLNLIEKLSTKNKKIVVVFDEFQEVNKIEKNLDKKLRGIIQHHKMVNYIMLGSQEALMRIIFENKKSPLYHFGHLMLLNRIPYNDFLKFLMDRLNTVKKENTKLCKKILDFTKLHPYYTQQLAFNVWENLKYNNNLSFENIIENSITAHDNDYERLWGVLTKTEMKIMLALAVTEDSPLTDEVRNKFMLGATSTVFSALKKLIEKGFVVQIEKKYDIEDPFFKKWIILIRKGK